MMENCKFEGKWSVDSVCRRAQDLAAEDAPPQMILGYLVDAAERIQGAGTVSSILVLDEEGFLRNGASPNLPQDYLHAIDRLRPCAGVGTCAAAAATGRIVVTPSFLADDKWAELRHLPLALGFVGAWSMPIKSNLDERVLGTFGTYYRSVRHPSEADFAAISALAASAAQLLDVSRRKFEARSGAR